MGNNKGHKRAHEEFYIACNFLLFSIAFASETSTVQFYNDFTSNACFFYAALKVTKIKSGFMEVYYSQR